MQYLLSQEEYDELRKSYDKIITSQNTIIQRLCTIIAKNVPHIASWSDDKTPWGCILVDKIRYCDGCPVQKDCPSKQKNYSK